MKRRLVKTAATLIVALASVTGVSAQNVPESKKPIKMALLEWTGQQAATKVTGAILKKMGYDVDYITSGSYTVFLAMPDGKIDVQMEVWSSNTGEFYPKAMASGNIDNLGQLGLEPHETWYYNDAAQEACPELPDWNALKSCGEALASAETFPKGRLLDYPAEWGTTNVNRIEALDLPLTSIPAGSEGALVAEIKSAEQRKTPLLVMFWSPHWIHAVAKLHTVTLPPYEKGCKEDPKLGINPGATFDCDWPTSEITKLAWAGMKGEWPAAYKMISAVNITNEDEIGWMRAIDADGKDIDSVVAAWIEKNQDRWQGWVDAAMAK